MNIHTKHIQTSLFALALLTGSAQAETGDRLAEAYRIPQDVRGLLVAKVESVEFLKDNEYSGGIQKGYTLPGFRLSPRLIFFPHDNIKLEAGAYLLRYWGARRYPCYAYSDIARWQGEQYQHGFHALPWLRAQFSLGEHWNIVLGNIYGAGAHGLLEPLYNPELSLTADPEAGAQILFDTERVHLDIWGSWDSFIFRGDTHQEAFTVGAALRLRWNRPEAPVHFYTDVQALAQHRGGEIDTITVSSVQTLMNGAVAAGAVWNTRGRHVRAVGGEVSVAGYYQQAGELLPYDDGYGVYVRGWAEVHDFRVKAAFWHSKTFVPLFGSPFFGAVSQAESGVFYPKQQLVQWGAEYARSFGREYTVGVKADVYHHLGLGTSFSAGIFMRISPEFVIKRFR